MRTNEPTTQDERQTGPEEYQAAELNNADRWVPACGGNEEPFNSRSGLRLLYVYNFRTGEHRYLNLGSDLIMPLDFDPAS